MAYFQYSLQELDALKAKDKRLREVIDQFGWIQREVHDDLFSALLSSIVGQQISAKAAKTVWANFVQLVKTVSAEAVYETSIEAIQKCGMSMRKAMYMKDIAHKIIHHELDHEELWHLPDDEVIASLSGLQGIGKWTAQMLMIFCMQRKDVLSWDDLAIRRGMMRLYRHKTLTKQQFERYRKRYSPYGSIASLYLWKLSE